MPFSLHPQLAKDCARLGETALCEVLLLNDRQFPWIILVPKQDGISEVFQLEKADQVGLTNDSSQIGQRMMEHYKGDKLNLGALGNMVSQLHVHIIVRFKSDAAWPKPVWGNYTAKPYSADELKWECSKLRELLGKLLVH